MERLITKEIIKWKNDRDNFPLFILGARQIGKTFIVKEFAKNTYKNKYIYINFYG
ncbi:MAG: AAA family ATPase [Mycoplasmataceae bacterium]|nr:AAA family ATPase [Mycoplasmataceae bacterium]